MPATRCPPARHPSQGHYTADPSITPATLADRGAMKRSVLSLGRARADILHALDGEKLKALVKAGFPLDDRKVRGAGGQHTSISLQRAASHPSAAGRENRTAR